LALETRLLPLEESVCPAGDRFSGEALGSEPDASISPAKAPLPAVSEKNISPMNAPRIAVDSEVALRVLVAEVLVENTRCSESDPVAPQRGVIEHTEQHERQGVVL
jgi:hypothetical protein